MDIHVGSLPMTMRAVGINISNTGSCAPWDKDHSLKCPWKQRIEIYWKVKIHWKEKLVVKLIQGDRNSQIWLIYISFILHTFYIHTWTCMCAYKCILCVYVHTDCILNAYMHITCEDITKLCNSWMDFNWFTAVKLI